MSTTLVAHRGARIVERVELDTVEAPSPTDAWSSLADRHARD